MRITLMLLACLVVSGTATPVLAAVDDSTTQSSPPPQSGHECERRRDTPTS